MSKTNILAVGVSNDSVFEAKISNCNTARQTSVDFQYLIFNNHFSSKIAQANPDVVLLDCLSEDDLMERYPFQTLCAKTPHIAVVAADANARAAELRRKGVRQVVSLDDVKNDGPASIITSCLANADSSTTDKPFYALADASPVAMMIFQHDQFLYANPAACALTGFSQTELIKMSFRRIVDSDYQNLVKTRIARLLLGKSTPKQYEIKIQKKNGDKRTVDFSAERFEYRGEPAALVVCIDVTDRKKYERALKKSEHSYRGLFDSFADAIYLLNDAGEFIDVNKGASLMHGYGREFFIGKSLTDLAAHGKNNFAVLSAHLTEAFKGRTQEFEFWSMRADGSSFPANIHLYRGAYFGESVVIAFAQDITTQQHDKELLRMGKERIQSLYHLSQMNDATDAKIVEFALEEAVRLTGSEIGYLHFITGDKVHLSQFTWSKAVKKICKTPMDEMKPLDESGLWAESIRTGRPAIYNDYPDQSNGAGLPGGHVPLNRYMAVPIMDNDKIVAVAGVGNKADQYDDFDVMQLQLFMAEMWKIIQRRQNSALLNKLSSAISQSQISVLMTDANGTIEYINPMFSEITGYSPEEVLGKNPSVLKSGNTPPHVYQELWQTLLSGGAWKGELQNKRKNGELFWESVILSGVRDADGRLRAFIGLKEDITEKKKLQEEKQTLEHQLQQSQKLETLGTLTGGIAHDFNNLLTPIMGYADIGSMKSKDNKTLHDYFEMIREASERAKELVTQMLNFSRRSEISKSPMALQPLIKKSVRLIRSSIPSTVAIELDLDAESLDVKTHPAHVQQILMNLCANAFQAMPDQKGVISISLKTAAPGSPIFDKYASLENRDFAWLSVKDDGLGIAPEKIEHIFDPFFTTKDAGKGTGLGLSIVKGIVKNSGGKVFVESSSGNGTTFNIFLPIAQDAPKRKAKMKQEISQGKGRILIIDDEPAIVGLLKDMLTAFGYTPIGVQDPREALELFEKENETLDLVLTDLTMPNLPGLELAKHMHLVNPAVPIIVLTGYCESVSDDLLNENCIYGVLNKPMVVGEVAGAIQKALQARLAA